MSSRRPRFSYHVSHEQFAPSELLDFVRRAEASGFDSAFSSDHLQPWAAAQGQSGFTWSWLGAAMQATERLTFGAITVPLGWRYHPVVLAQAVATLGQLFPGRLPWVAVGSGEALNERVVCGDWPEKAERNERLREGAQIMKALLAGETVNYRGRITAIDAQLWSRPAEPTSIVGAAVSPDTARWLGSWADGLLTTAGNLDTFRNIIDAFREGGGMEKPVFVKTQVSCARTDTEALRFAHEQWRFNVLSGTACADFTRPEDFERGAESVRPEDVADAVFVSSSPERHVEWLRDLAALGPESIDIHNVGRNQREFIDTFGESVLRNVVS